MGPSFADFGGPLACSNKLVGIMSQYKANSVASAFTRISAYSDWIKANNSNRIGISWLMVLIAALAKLMF